MLTQFWGCNIKIKIMTYTAHCKSFIVTKILLLVVDNSCYLHLGII